MTINLKNPNGKLFTVPATGRHPFDGEDTISVFDATVGKEVSFPGTLKKFEYGFTSKSLADYLKDDNVPWLNSDGEPAMEGIIGTPYRSVPTNKPFLENSGEKVWVPAGRNLVFRLVAENVDGPFETKAYFVKS